MDDETKIEAQRLMQELFPGQCLAEDFTKLMVCRNNNTLWQRAARALEANDLEAVAEEIQEFTSVCIRALADCVKQATGEGGFRVLVHLVQHEMETYAIEYVTARRNSNLEWTGLP